MFAVDLGARVVVLVATDIAPRLAETFERSRLASRSRVNARVEPLPHVIVAKFDAELQYGSDIMRGFPVRQFIIWQRAGGWRASPASVCLLKFRAAQCKRQRRLQLRHLVQHARCFKPGLAHRITHA